MVLPELIAPGACFTINKVGPLMKKNLLISNNLTINKKDISHLTISLDYEGPIEAPINKGTQVANIVVSMKNEVLKTLPLYAAEDLKKVNIFKSLLASLNYLIWGDV